MSKELTGMDRSEALRRRTFAIISHPDAGKTTITEKILWLGGVIREAGEVKGKANTKAATSDWMAMEKERGVSITSSVMQFDYRGLRVNLLDTPGHKDFGEDTYRTLHAADSAAMLVDAAKGVEEQTRKLFDVCRLRRIPIFTFANKMDREGKDPLGLIDDVENTLGIRCFPVTWPMGMGGLFKGLYHRIRKEAWFFVKGEAAARVVPVSGPDDPLLVAELGPEVYPQFIESSELLEATIGDLDIAEFLAGEVTPMSFGSAKYLWGVDLFLDLFTELAPAPQSYQASGGAIAPLNSEFTAFVFKMQANMDRKHRDRIAFARICSGKFERGMKVWHPRLGRELRLAYASQFLAQDRDTVEAAFPGDVVGLIDPGHFRIGDTITGGSKFEFEALPRFSPEVFARLNIKDPLKRKQLHKALDELAEEGSIQIFIDPKVGHQDPIVAAVGELQFDVLLYRLRDEYRLDVKLERLGFSVARWPKHRDTGVRPPELSGGARVYQDALGYPVVLLDQLWDLKWLERENPELEFWSNCA